MEKAGSLDTKRGVASGKRLRWTGMAFYILHSVRRMKLIMMNLNFSRSRVHFSLLICLCYWIYDVIILLQVQCVEADGRWDIWSCLEGNEQTEQRSGKCLAERLHLCIGGVCYTSTLLSSHEGTLNLSHLKMWCLAV